LRQNSMSRPLSAINDLFDSRDFLFTDKSDEVLFLFPCLARPWQGPGKVLARPWQGPGKVLARPWQGPGKALARRKALARPFVHDLILVCFFYIRTHLINTCSTRLTTARICKNRNLAQCLLSVWTSGIYHLPCNLVSGINE
jgi:hypothetical protein